MGVLGCRTFCNGLIGMYVFDIWIIPCEFLTPTSTHMAMSLVLPY